ncbi:MAG: type 4a pilus biogenesis protein PilO [Candidatus Paceibacterota bacterium]|jgi:Tfp pilus assembly protein PilO
MSKLIFSIFCLVVSVVLVFSAGSAILNGGSDSPWSFLLGENNKGLNELLAERASLNQALANADRIKNKIVDLQKIESSISADDLDKLNKFIPSHVDNVNLIIDVNNIAAKQGVIIKNVQVRSTPDSSTSGAPVETLSNQKGILPTYMTFSVSGNYQVLTSFLDDLANSLRVVDPSSLSFAVDEKGLNQYNFEIKTYWVK